jgi:predicted  nucleic acid-binding Zn-ribbon protein
VFVSENSNTNLFRYQCSRCGRPPQKAQELFQGCSCGHRFFRIVNPNRDSKSSLDKNSLNKTKRNLGILTVREREVGVYDINVEKLLDSKLESPVVVGNNGVFSIHIKQNQKK